MSSKKRILEINDLIYKGDLANINNKCIELLSELASDSELSQKEIFSEIVGAIEQGMIQRDYLYIADILKFELLAII